MGSGQFAFVPPGSSGRLCIGGGQLVRLLPPKLDSGPGGTFSHAPGTTGPPLIGAVVPGQTWNYQAWFRDAGSTSNFTDAVSVTFE